MWAYSNTKPRVQPSKERSGPKSQMSGEQRWVDITEIGFNAERQNSAMRSCHNSVILQHTSSSCWSLCCSSMTSVSPNDVITCCCSNNWSSAVCHNFLSQKQHVCRCFYVELFVVCHRRDFRQRRSDTDDDVWRRGSRWRHSGAE